MTTNKVRLYLGAMIVAAQFALVGCGSNAPSTMSGSGGSSGSATGGATGSASGGATGSASGGATGSASGGATGSASGGATGTASGGTTGTASGGTSGGGASGSGTYSPLCSAVPVTAAGEAPTKGGACTSADTQLCYKTCGPASIGFKSETCTGGTYAEQSGCSFSQGVDYSCYKIPTAVDATCPTAVPQANTACTVAPCTLCNVAGSYLDSSGASKTGYCVCPMAGASGTSKWSCASTTAWPCPAGQGC